MQTIPWYERDSFWTTFRPVLFHDARREAAGPEVTGFVTLAGLQAGGRVLDVGCGPGRHSLELARRGYQVTALDRTRAYLDELAGAASAEGLDVEVVERDMRALDEDARYDAALCAFTTFGYFDDPADDRRVLEGVLRALRPGGTLLIDVLGKEVVARGIVGRWWTWLEPEVLLLEERTVEGAWDSLVSRWTMLQGAKRREFEMRHRLYAATELRDLLRRVGFNAIHVFGDWDGAPYDGRADRLIVTATRG